MDLERTYPAQPKEIRKHLFKLLYRALQIDIVSRDKLALMRLVTEEDKMEARELIGHLSQVMEERGDNWVLEDCTLMKTSWYRRYRKDEEEWNVCLTNRKCIIMSVTPITQFSVFVFNASFIFLLNRLIQVAVSQCILSCNLRMC